MLLVCFEPGEELRAAGTSAASAENVQDPILWKAKADPILWKAKADPSDELRLSISLIFELSDDT